MTSKFKPGIEKNGDGGGFWDLSDGRTPYGR